MSAMLLMMAGTVMMACTSDNEVIVPEEQVPEDETTAKGEETTLPDASDFIKVVSDTGYMSYDADEEFWYVDTPLASPDPNVVMIDGGTAYYMYDLPEEYKVKGLKVKFTGDAYKFKADKNGDDICHSIGGYEYYDVVVKEIEIVE